MSPEPGPALRSSWARTRARLANHRGVRTLSSEPVVLVLCSLAIVAFGVTQAEANGYVPIGALVLPFLIGALLLNTRALVFLDVVAFVTITYVVVRLGLGPHGARLAGGVVVGLAAVFAHVVASSRERIGVKGLRSDAMLIDLRQRLSAPGVIPTLPADWKAEVAMRSAGGSAFGGDFVVSALSGDGKCLEVAVVDVSGKGIDAGTRALQLSGAFGGLIGSLPPQDFLKAASSYLLRQEWLEGFATAVHACIDLTTGDFTVDSAGHPPAVQFDAGSGRWCPLPASGAMLGLLESPAFHIEHGILESGDALLLYTDGLIEVRGRDLDVGVDKLLGEAERLLLVGFDGGARRLVDTVAADASDDRAVVIIRRV